MKHLRWYYVVLLLGISWNVMGQDDSTRKMPRYKNVIRYNLSGALIFGANKYIILGYERVVAPRQSFSINAGQAAMPKMISINTDSFNVNKDSKRSGFNVSVDYRFYLAKENKFEAPHGFYIGPYYGYTRFNNEAQWNYKNPGAHSSLTTSSKFTINNIGFELGYQLVLWKRMTLDFVMVGPGIGFYNYKASFDGNVDAATKEQIFDGLKQLLTQKFPGMNLVFSDKEISSSGTMRASTIGYRYIIHIGFLF